MAINKELEDSVLIGDLQAVKKAISKDYDINAKDKYGRTIIYDAILKNYPSIIELLCESGANLNIHDEDGKTPLHFAVMENNFNIVNTLIARGANVNSKDNNGNSIICEAVFYSEGKPEIILLLKKNGADPTIANNYGVNAIGLAETISNFDVSDLLK